MTRPDILRFLLLSTGVHIAVLASWAAPTLPTYHALAALSVGLIQETPVSKRPAGKSVIKQSPATKAPAAAIAKSRSNHAHRESRTAQAEAPAVAHKPLPDIVATRVSHPDQPIEAGPPRSQAAAVSAPAPGGVLAPVETQARAEDTQANSSNGAQQAARDLRALIQGRLETDLSRYFFYPAIARKHGWEGSVRVGFTLEPDGRLTRVRIAQSSGYEVLDSSALKALSRVGNLREAATWLNGKSLEIELPVIYRLQEP